MALHTAYNEDIHNTLLLRHGQGNTDWAKASEKEIETAKEMAKEMVVGLR